MESKSTSGVLCRSFKHYPYDTGSVSGKEKTKEEVVGLGVELSVSVAESMFLLCDDTRTMLSLCYKLWKYVVPYANPVIERLLRVIHYVYTKEIKPKNGIFQKGDGKSVQWNLIRTTWDDFVCGILVLHRLVLVLREKDGCFDDRLLSSAVAKYKQELKKLEDKLRSGEDVSEANGFCRDTIKSNILCFWNKSLFDEETPGVIERRIVSELFETLVGEPLDMEIRALPLHLPYILGKDFAKQELKEEAVELGVEISVCVAQWMFFLCDDVRSMLCFCLKLWRDAENRFYRNSPVVERLLRVIHYVYLSGIKPKNGIYKNDGGLSVQMRVAWPALKDFDFVLAHLHIFAMHLRLERSFPVGRLYASIIEDTVKKIHETLRRAKTVGEANGFRREAIEPSIFGLWKSLFDKEAKEATKTLEVIKNGLLHDLFLPLLNEVAGIQAHVV